MRIRVDGGTNAGNKPSLKPRPKPWECKCYVMEIDAVSGHTSATGPPTPKTNIGALVACTDCGERRPE